MRALASIAVRLFAIVPALALSTFTFPGPAQDRVLTDDRSLLAISNDKLTLSVRTQGGAMVRMVLNDDPDKVNPMHAGLGHFVCVDGFGPVSPEERKAGLPGHGEAHRVPWEVVSSEKKIDMMDAHVSQMYEWLPWVAGTLDKVPKDAAARRRWLRDTRADPPTSAVRAALTKWYGAERGNAVRHAEAFEICEYGTRPDETMIRKLFPFLPGAPRD